VQVALETQEAQEQTAQILYLVLSHLLVAVVVVMLMSQVALVALVVEAVITELLEAQAHLGKVLLVEVALTLVTMLVAVAVVVAR
jgi:hypothetical protein